MISYLTGLVTSISFTAGIWVNIPVIQPLVRSWLFCIQHFPSLVCFVCMLGVDVEVWTKNILYRGIEDQTQFCTSWHARVSLTLNDPIQSVLGLNLSTHQLQALSKDAPKSYRTCKVLWAEQPTPDQSSGWIGWLRIIRSFIFVSAIGYNVPY